MVLLFFALSVSVRAEKWPDRPINIVVASRVGGSLDNMARGLAKYLKPILGVPVIVTNKPGAITLIANQEFIKQPADGYTFLVTVMPYLVGAMLNFKVDYEISDFLVLNDQWTSAEALHLHRKHKYSDLIALLDDVKKNPKKLSVGVFAKSGGHLGLLLTLKAMDIPVKNLRIVYFDSGNQFRTALAGGHIDFAIMPLESVYTVRDFVRTIVVFSANRQAGFEEIETINESLKTLAIHIKDVPKFTRSLLVRSEFQTDYPDRFARIVSAVQSILSDEKFQKEMDKMFVGRQWVGPEISTQNAHFSYESFKIFNIK